MADIGKLLETLHPMREPPAPEPVVPILLMMTLGICAAAAIFVLVRYAPHRGGALRRAAEAALSASRRLSPAERIAAQALMLRRLVRGLDGDAEARKQGRAWLESLDRRFGTHFFTEGPGAAFGDALYRTPTADVDALDEALAGFLTQVRA